MEEQVSMEAFLEDNEDSESEIDSTASITDSTDSESELPYCPWCLGDNIVEKEDITACGECDARIPVDADWYQEGKKVVI